MSAQDGQLNLVLLGAPGSGKGTQAERIIKRHELPHISTGDILRDAVAKGTDLGATAKRYMDAGDLVPDDVIIGIMRARLGCGANYNVIFSPPREAGVCDTCGGELYQRSDDNEETVRNRLTVYRRQTEPLVGYYEEHALVRLFHGGGRGPDDVFAEVEAVLSGAGTV
jgi:adenylate kinase